MPGIAAADSLTGKGRAGPRLFGRLRAKAVNHCKNAASLSWPLPAAIIFSCGMSET